MFHPDHRDSLVLIWTILSSMKRCTFHPDHRDSLVLIRFVTGEQPRLSVSSRSSGFFGADTISCSDVKQRKSFIPIIGILWC